MSAYTEQLETEINEKDAQIEALEAERTALRRQLCRLHGYFGWNSEDLTDIGKAMLNETANLLNSFVRYNLTSAFTYFHEVDVYPLLPAGDAGMFPAAHPRPSVPAALADNYECYADFVEDVETFWNLDECLEYPCAVTLEHAYTLLRDTAWNSGYEALLPAYEKFIAACQDNHLLMAADRLLADYAPCGDRDNRYYGQVRR